MATSFRWTSADLELLPFEDGKRYEIIDGELYVSEQPSFDHQHVCTVMLAALHHWSVQAQAGRPVITPGLIFADDDDVAPDLVWDSSERLAQILGPERKLHGPPELVVEVLSPGARNEQRDRQAKLNLYSRRGVDEYWIVEWMQRRIEVYRRAGAALDLVATLGAGDVLESPLLPGFACRVGDLFPPPLPA